MLHVLFFFDALMMFVGQQEGCTACKRSDLAVVKTFPVIYGASFIFDDLGRVTG